MIRLLVTLTILAVLCFPTPSVATTCTSGTDCYCDKVNGGSLNDPSVLVCEDFEATTLYNNVGAGNGSPYYGPWYDATGQSGNRGVNSYWSRKYGNGVGAVIWSSGQPSSPTLGAACGFSFCSGMKVWHPSDLWQANSLSPCATVLRNGDFASDVGTLTSPSGSAGGGSGVFDGVQTFGHRIPPGMGGGHDCGILGTAAFTGGRRNTFGVTMAMAFPTNTQTSGIWTDAWKFNEWHPVAGGAGGDGLFGFGHSGGGADTYAPFYGFMFIGGFGAGFQAACDAAKNAATKTIGSFTCNDVAFYWFPGGTYARATDWPYGTWGCMRAHYQNMGQANTSMEVWFTGPAGVEKKVLDISGMDTSMLQAGDGLTGYDYLIWNNYYNGNFDNGINTGTTATTFRYEDNLHIRAGAPVSCAQIGFAAGSTPVPGLSGAAKIQGGVILK